MFKILSYISLILVFVIKLNGSIIDLQVGIGGWNASPSGSFKYGNTNPTNLQFKDTLGIDSKINGYFYADLSHFIPILPNIRFEKQNLKTEGKKNLDNIKFGDKIYSTSTKSNIDLSQTDFILYWSVPFLNTLSTGIIDTKFGIDVRKFYGEINLEDSSNNENVKIDFLVPLGYASIKVSPPFIGASITATTKYIKYSGNSLSDNSIKLTINLPIPIALIDLKFDIGYKKQEFKIDKDISDSIDGNIKFDGVFAGIEASF